MELRVDTEACKAVIEGQLPVHVGGGKVQTFAVRIVYKTLNPFVIPETYTSDDRFPPKSERHIEDDGQWCMWLPQDAPRDFDSPAGLERYLARVRSFIVLQLAYEDRVRLGITPAWPGSEWGHGFQGHEQWVREQIGDLSPQVVRLLIGQAASRAHGMPCPCGSHRLFAACHQGWARHLLAVARREPAVKMALASLDGPESDSTHVEGGM